jgi:hypothetical protein
MNVPFAKSLTLASLFVVSSVAAPNAAISSTALLDCAGLPCVDVQVASGKQLRLGIDTGNVTSVLNAQAAVGLGLKTEPYVGNNGQRVPGLEIASISGVKIGATAIGTVRMAVMNLSDQISAGKFPNIDGTLAYTRFRAAAAVGLCPSLIERVGGTRFGANMPANLWADIANHVW